MSRGVLKDVRRDMQRRLPIGGMWFERYEEARKKGEPFDEPPPDGR